MVFQEKGLYPAVTLHKSAFFPGEKLSLLLEGEETRGSVEEAVKNGKQLIFVFQKNGEKSQVAVAANILQHWELSPTIIGLVVEGLRRVIVVEESHKNGIKMAVTVEIPEEEVFGNSSHTDLEALARSALDEFKKVLQTEGLVPLLVAEDLQKEHLPPDKAADLVSSVLKLDFSEKLQLIETLDLKRRLEILNNKLADELNIAQAEVRIQEDIEKEVSQAQKEYVLRERMKAIEKELGIYQEQKEYDILEQKINQSGLPEEARGRILGELHRLRQMSASGAEVPYIHTYLEWITDLPWSKRSETTVDLKRAREVLDEDHYGLEKAKERVLQYLAVQKLTEGKGRGSILCFVGPPGTGKTSVGQSIARALGRKFVRVSLGGIRDEAEIRGHRRTYVGALPGRIIQGMRTAGTKNPVFMMDEVDKIGMDFRGDPAAALLEVLDPAQNNSFSDHYIEIPFDLSEVFFITTANILDPIPPALCDRMEVIEFPGYTDDEKFHIARKFLLPRVLSGTGLSPERLTVDDKAIYQIINNYTREAGVRELERKLSEIARKVVLHVTEGHSNGKVAVTTKELGDYLGPEEFEITTQEKEDEVGVATGLAWTPAGGEIIFVEATLAPGKGNLTLTGQLGEVMKESALAALSYVRSHSRNLGFPENFYYKSDIHIHVPSGAIPKDGPSAGIAVAIALASRLTKHKVRKDVALTGEITLGGKVLKVGGMKEKVLAAHRGGARVIIIPEGNEKNLVDIPQEVRKELEFKSVKNVDEALNIALR